MLEKSDRTRVVLLVDDNADGSGPVRDMLFDAEGYRLEQVGTVAEGVELLRSVEVDIILIHLGSLERRLVEEVKTVCAAAGQTPIVVMAETTDERVARECINAGAQDCLLKHEIRPQVIRRAIDKSIARMHRTHVQVVGHLAAGVAHNFNDIFTAVMGHVEPVLDNATDERDRVRLTAVLDEARQGGELSRKLLGFAGLLPLRPEIVFPSSYLADVVALLNQCLACDITLVADLPDDLWPVSVDPDEFRTALFNLVFNASEAMPSGGTIRMSACNEPIGDGRLGLLGRYLVIRLRDEGGGIPAPLLLRVVDPFFTTKDVEAHCGLGLSQAHGFAQQSRGTIDIESSPGEGTTVTLFLPSDPSHANIVAFRTCPRRAEVRLRNAIETGATVLLVKDDIAAATAVVEMLRRSGFATELVRDAVAALRLLDRGKQVDLVLSDIVMPDGVSGIEFAAVVQECFPRVAVLFTAADPVLASIVAGQGLHVVTRPYGPDELCGCIADLVRASTARRAQGRMGTKRRSGSSTPRNPADAVSIDLPRPASSPPPLAPPDRDGPSQTCQPQEGAGFLVAAGEWGPPEFTILFVEDETDIRDSVAAHLASSGFCVLAPPTSREALHLFGEHRIDALFTDIVMPDIGGIDLARAARRLRPDLKVLFMTGYSSFAGEAEKIGPLLHKPARATQIESELRKLLATG